jgi:hypothetical protein
VLLQLFRAILADGFTSAREAVYEEAKGTILVMRQRHREIFEAELVEYKEEKELQNPERK